MERPEILMKLSIVVLLLALPQFSFMESIGMSSTPLKIIDERSDNPIWALSGTESIEKASSLTYIGESSLYAQSPGGHLGECIWTGDLNGDGNPDMGVAAPMLNGTNDYERAGRFYLFYGSGSMTRGTIDLSSYTPDLTILGGRAQCGLLDSFAIGDIDGDSLTDLILGVPVQDSCGRVYVLWGQGPWTGTKTLVDPGRLSPDGPTGGYGFLNTNEYSIIAGDLAPVPAPSDNYEVGRIVRCDDLDKDGFDDLVFSTPGWNKVNIVWGSSSRMDFGDELTMIDDSVDYGRFGDCTELGDINGNDQIDLVATAPIRNDEGRGFAQVGAAFAILDIGRIRGNSTIITNAPDLVRPMILGSDPYDRFGTTLALEDLNGDGKDEIIISAPQSDGLKDDSDGAGSIHVFLGGQSNQFPLEMDAESGAEWVIYGQMKDSGGYPGDQLGNTFALPDFDSDGKPDLVIALPDRDNGTDTKAGMVVGYPSSKIFTSAKKDIEIKDLTERFAIRGIDPYDRIGYRLSWADWDMDGADDIYISSPASDGIDNDRKECGALFLVYGISISIDRVWLSGPGMVGSQIVCGQGEVEINVNVSTNLGPSAIGSMMISIPYLGASMSFPPSQGSIPDVSSSYGMIKSVKGIGLLWIGTKGTLTVHTVFEWWFPTGTYDMVLKVGQNDLTRTYPKMISAVSTIVSEGPTSIKRNGYLVPHPEVWFGVGDIINMTGFQIFYDVGSKVPCWEDAPFKLLFSDSGTPLGEIPAGGGGHFAMVLTSPGVRNISVLTVPDMTKFPSGLPEGFLPKMPEDIDLSFRVDGDVPDTVTGIMLIPDDVEGPYDDDTLWNITWDADWLEGDALSGVKEYEIYDAMEPTNRTVARSHGGLFATYYNDDRFLTPAQMRIDSKLEFKWGRFPPMTDIVPEGYSIRWHGWLTGPEQGTTRFTLSGQGGSACIFLSGEELLPWGDLTTRRITSYVGIAEGEFVPIEVYFKQAGGDGVVFNLRWESVSGDTVEIPKDSLFHPSNMTEIIISKAGPFTAMVEAIDWVGLRSAAVGKDGFLDDVPPEINLTEFRTWYNTTDTRIVFSCSDPGSSLGIGSGMDQESIRYRIKETWMKDYGPWTDDDIWSITKNGQDYDVLIRTELSQDFRGFIQFKATDIVGNQAESGSHFIGVDITGPKFTVVEPSLIVQHIGTTVTFYVRVTDTAGSGVNGSTVKMRTRTNDTAWSAWSDIGTGTSGEEVASEFQKVLLQGWNRIQFSAIDMVGNTGYSEEHTLVVKAKSVDLPPEPVISSPKNGTSFTEGTPVLMDGSTSKDDGIGRFDDLRFTWSSNKSGYLGSGKSIKYNKLSLGWHRITLYVDDGTPGHNISAAVEIRIKPVFEPNDGNRTGSDNDDPPYLLYLAIFAGIVMVLTLLVIIVTRKRTGTDDEEVKIEYRVSSTSDLEYDERLAEEEREIGLDIGPNPPMDPEEERRKLYGGE